MKVMFYNKKIVTETECIKFFSKLFIFYFKYQFVISSHLIARAK